MMDRIHKTRYCNGYYGADPGLLYTVPVSNRSGEALHVGGNTQTVTQTWDPTCTSRKNYFLNQFRHIGGEKQPIQCQPTLQVYLKLSPDTAMLLAPFGWPGYAGPSGMRNNLREPSHTVHTQFLNFNLLNKTPASPCYACCPCKSIQATPGKTDPTTHTCNPTKKVCSLQSY